MYQFSENEIALIKLAQQVAAALAKAIPFKVECDEDFARQFLTREIMQLIREGECEPSKLADAALGRLRGFIQTKESAKRLSEGGNKD